MKNSLAFLLVTAVLVRPAAAQTPAGSAAPQARLGYFVGAWSVEARTEASPLGPAGEVRVDETCEWFANHHLICRSNITSPRGQGEGHVVMSWDAARGTYTYHGVNSFGDNYFVRGSVDDRVWTWADEIITPEAKIPFRVLMTEETPTSYTFRMEVADGSGGWTLVEAGTATKR